MAKKITITDEVQEINIGESGGTSKLYLNGEEIIPGGGGSGEFSTEPIDVIFTDEDWDEDLGRYVRKYPKGALNNHFIKLVDNTSSGDGPFSIYSPDFYCFGEIQGLDLAEGVEYDEDEREATFVNTNNYFVCLNHILIQARLEV